ncbi:MAG: cation transporter [Candidatus Omnitrophota bacterium]
MKKMVDVAKEKKEFTVYGLFYFFLASFLVKVVFGGLAGSKTLLVSGLFSLFGVFLAVVSLIRIGRMHPARGARVNFNADKLEFIIVLGASLLITLSTGMLLYSTGHMVFFHTLYPPQMLAAWVSLVVALGGLIMIFWSGNKIWDIPEVDNRDMALALSTDFLLSILTVFTVVIARHGATLPDYACAILTAFFMIIYGIVYLKSAFKGLMDAAGDEELTGEIRKLVMKVKPSVAVEALRVSRSGHVLEIMLTLGVGAGASMNEVTATGKRVKDALRRKLDRPHELFLGMSLKEGA